MKRKRTNAVDNAVGKLKMEAGIERVQVENLVNSSRGAFILSKALCLAIETLDASDPDVENMILIRDHLFPVYLLMEEGITEDKRDYGTAEALLGALESLEEKLSE